MYMCACALVDHLAVISAHFQHPSSFQFTHPPPARVLNAIKINYQAEIKLITKVIYTETDRGWRQQAGQKPTNGRRGKHPIKRKEKRANLPHSAWVKDHMALG
jgi:hypothetical protein